MSVRLVAHAVAVPGARVAVRRRWVKPRTNLTAKMVRSAGLYPSGLYGVKHRQPSERRVVWPGRSRQGWWSRFADDRDLTGMKLALVGVLLLIVMALEVPW